MGYRFFFGAVAVLLVAWVFVAAPIAVEAQARPLTARVNEAFRAAFGRGPTGTENRYWLDRVVRGDKATFQSLVDAMRYHRAQGRTMGGASSAGTVAGATISVPDIQQIVALFRNVFGTAPTHVEQEYWKSRRYDKPSIEELRGAMLFQRERGRTVGAPLSSEELDALRRNRLIIDVLPIFVRIYGNDPTEVERAWWRQRISCGEINDYDQLTVSMAYHRHNGARMGRATICGQTDGIYRGGVVGLENHPMGPHIRVGIYSTNGSAMHATANGQFQVRRGRSDIVATLQAGEVVQVSWSGGRYRIVGPGLDLESTQEVRLVPLNMAVMELVGFTDDGSVVPFPGGKYNRFRGVIEVRKCVSYTNSVGRVFECRLGSHGSASLWAINELRVEYYLRGLAETSGTGPVEYLKALGTAARTYALYHMIVTGGRYPAEGFDITNTANDQLYRGYEYEQLTGRMSGIFDETKGVVITDAVGNLRVPMYFSDSDGQTRHFPDPAPRFSHLHHSVADPHSKGRTCGIGGNHCYGMSAQGAFGFALHDGWVFMDILQYYYKGVQLIQGY